MRHCAWKDLACCTSPASIRRLNLFAAACPFIGIGPYTAKAALILMPNTAGGCLTSPANQLGLAPGGNGDRNQPKMGLRWKSWTKTRSIAEPAAW